MNKTTFTSASLTCLHEWAAGEEGKIEYCSKCGVLPVDLQRAILERDAPAGAPDVSQAQAPEGKRERFEKWVLRTKHPVLGFLDGRWLARGDDRTGYADSYVQGLWIAYLEFGGDRNLDAPAKLSFPVMLRKMWSGGEVQDWLNQQGPLFTRPMSAKAEDAVTFLRKTINLMENDHDKLVDGNTELRAKLVERDALLRRALGVIAQVGAPDHLIDYTMVRVVKGEIAAALADTADPSETARHYALAGAAPEWLPMRTAPRDGTLLRLLVRFKENSTEACDTAPTLGLNGFHFSEVDEWQFAGWCRKHDEFTAGKGTPVGWLPLFEAQIPVVESHAAVEGGAK